MPCHTPCRVIRHAVSYAMPCRILSYRPVPCRPVSCRAVPCRAVSLRVADVPVTDAACHCRPPAARPAPSVTACQAVCQRSASRLPPPRPPGLSGDAAAPPVERAFSGALVTMETGCGSSPWRPRGTTLSLRGRKTLAMRRRSGRSEPE